MAIKLEDKKAIVAEVNEAAKAALSAVVADARGVTVGAMTGLRKEAREAGVYVKVVRNTLLKRAVERFPPESAGVCFAHGFVRGGSWPPFSESPAVDPA